MLNRMLRAARLETALYEEVEADSSATGQALAVVALSGLAVGISSLQVGGWAGLVLGTIAALIGWFLWSLLTFVIGTTVLKTEATHATYGQLLRTVGFASAPGILRVLAIVPLIANVVMLVTSVWMLIAMVIAVRQALDYTNTWRAIAVVAIGWVVYTGILVLMMVLGMGGR